MGILWEGSKEEKMNHLITKTPDNFCWKFKYFGDREYWSIHNLDFYDWDFEWLHGFSSKEQAEEVAKELS